MSIGSFPVRTNARDVSEPPMATLMSGPSLFCHSLAKSFDVERSRSASGSSGLKLGGVVSPGDVARNSPLARSASAAFCTAPQASRASLRRRPNSFAS
jgi:hypothetical protein